jgi:hypothetical protein
MPMSRPTSSNACRNGELHSPTVQDVSNTTNTYYARIAVGSVDLVGPTRGRSARVKY